MLRFPRLAGRGRVVGMELRGMNTGTHESWEAWGTLGHCSFIHESIRPAAPTSL